MAAPDDGHQVIVSKGMAGACCCKQKMCLTTAPSDVGIVSEAYCPSSCMVLCVLGQYSACVTQMRELA